MPLTKLRRPNFTRNFVKQNLFSANLSDQRLHKLQRLIQRKNLDCLIIIAGIDSRFNIGCFNVINYLLFDVFATRKDDIDRSKLEDETIDDIMIFVKSNSVDVYCNGANYWILLPYFGGWSNLQLHCLSEEEMEDIDQMENFKIATLFKITKDCDHIAVVTKSYEDRHSIFNEMDIENWPIIQSFGHDDFGRKSELDRKSGFFTMAHKVTDISEDVYAILHHLDPVRLEYIITKVVPLIDGLFENIFQLLDTVRSHQDFILDQKIIEEPVRSYFNHITKQMPDSIHNLEYAPFALAGPNTQKAVLNNYLYSNTNQSQLSSVSQLTNPTHLIVQCVNNPHFIVETRTLFLQGLTCLEHTDQNQELVNDINLLSNVYKATIQTVHSLINDSKCHSLIDLNKSKTEAQLNQNLQDVSYDSIMIGLHVDTNQFEDHGFILVVHAVVYDIRNSKKHNLGSVMFAETFVVSSMSLNNNDYLNSVMRIGKNIPLYHYWSNMNLSKLRKALDDDINPQQHEQSLTIDNIDLVVSDSAFNETVINQTFCIFYHDRIGIFTKRLGMTIIYPTTASYIEGDSYDDWSFVSLYWSKRSNPPNTNVGALFQYCDSISMAGDATPIHFVFTNRSKQRKTFTSHVLPMWKLSNHIQVNTQTSSASNKIPQEMQHTIWSLINNSQAHNHNTQTQAFEHTSSTQINSIINSLSDDAHKSNLLIALHQLHTDCTHRLSCVSTTAQFMLLAYSFNQFGHAGVNTVQFDRESLLTQYRDVWQCHNLVNKSHLLQIEAQLMSLSPLHTTTELANQPQCYISVLCGSPSNIPLQLAYKILSMVNENSNWLVIQPITVEQFNSQLKNLLRKYYQLYHDNLSNETNPTNDDSGDDDISLDISTLPNHMLRLIVLAPAFIGSDELLQSVPAILSGVHIKIANVCTCIDMKTAFIDDHSCLVPKLLDLCAEGFCQNVLIVGGKVKKVEIVQRLMRAHNEYCSLLCCASITDVNKHLDIILSLSAHQLPRQSLCRLLTQTNMTLRNAEVSGSRKARTTPISSSIIQLKYKMIIPLNHESIVKSIQNYAKCHGDSQQRHLSPNIYIDAYIKLENDHRDYHLTGSTAAGNGSVSLVINKAMNSPCGDSKSILPLSENLSLIQGGPSGDYHLMLFVIDTTSSHTKLDELKSDYYEALLRNFIKQPPPRKHLLTEENLSLDQLNLIHKARHLEQMPEGWFYNGLTYVHMDGTKSEKHPNLQLFIEDYLHKENQKIAEFNAEIDKFTINKVFE